MQIRITGNNIEITPALKTHVEEKFHKLVRIADNITDVHVTLKMESANSNQNHADANLVIPGTDIYASASSDDMYHTVILLVDKLTRQINKYKEKIRQ